MAEHYWNSTPPRLWPIVRLATERGWAVSIGRNFDERLTLRLSRSAITDPILTATWDFHYQDGQFQPGRRNEPGRWKLHQAEVRDGHGGKPMRANLGDLPRLIMEAGRG